jgi:hypothetical protein
LVWVRAQNAAHLAAYQDAAELAHTELEEVRCAAAKAVTDAQKIAEAAIRKAIADWDRILSERAADMDQQIDRAKADAQAQVTVIQSQLDAAKAEAKAEAEELVKFVHGELAYAAAVTHAGTENANTERVAKPDQEATVTQQRAQAGLAASRARGPSAHHKSKMTALVDKAQRMYDSRRFTIAEIAQTCAVSPTTIYRHIHTGQTTAH